MTYLPIESTFKVLSEAADNTDKIWNAETGQEILSWHHKTPVRSVNYALGDRTFVSVTDQVLGFCPQYAFGT
jgi:WD40 repeat protein